jgi:acetyl esterase/lipase
MKLESGPLAQAKAKVLGPVPAVHPQLCEALTKLAARNPEIPGGPEHVVSPEELSLILPELRRCWAADTSHVPACALQAKIEEQFIDGPAESPPVRIFIVRPPHRKSARPAILHMHGGGFIVGNGAEYLPVLQAQSMALDCVIVSVDYRLAPETPFPGSLEDNYAALKWLCANAEQLGAAPDLIALQGESAGGGHAAMLAIAARDRGEIPVRFLCLTYPMLDDRTGSSRAVPEHAGEYCWTAKYNRMGWSALLGVAAGSAKVPDGAAPARTVSLAGLPATFMWVGGLDLFAQENLVFASRLSEAGVAVELHLFPGIYHGFDGFAPGAPVTIAYKLTMLRALAAAFGTELTPSAKTFLTPATWD